MEDFDIPPDFFSQQGSGSLAANSQQASQAAAADAGRGPSGLARDACQPAPSAAHATSAAAGSAAAQLQGGAQAAAEEVPTRRTSTDAAHLPKPSHLGEGVSSPPAAAGQPHLAMRLEGGRDDAEQQPTTARAAAKPAVSPVPMRLLEAVLPAIPERDPSRQAAALRHEPEVHAGAAWCTAAASPAQAVGRIRAEGPTVMFDDGDGNDSPTPTVPGTPPGAMPSQQQSPPGLAPRCQSTTGKALIDWPTSPPLQPASASTALPPPTAGFQTAAGRAVAPAASAAALNKADSFFDDMLPGPPFQPASAGTALPPPTAGFQTAAGKAVAPAASAAAMNQAVSFFDGTPAQQTGQPHQPPPPPQEHRTPMQQRGRSSETRPNEEQADAAAMQAGNAAVQPAASTFRSPMHAHRPATPTAAAQPAASRVLQQVSARQAAAPPSATVASRKTFTPLRTLQDSSNSAADTPGTRSAMQRAAAAKPAIGRRGGVRTPQTAGARCAVRDMLL